MIGDALATVHDDDNTDTTISVTSEESVDTRNEQTQDEMGMSKEEIEEQYEWRFGYKEEAEA